VAYLYRSNLNHAQIVSLSVSQSGRSFGSSTVMRKGFDSGESDVFVKRLHGVSEVVVCHMSVFVVMFLHVRLRVYV
jgi:hypothetical protein